MPRGLFTDFLIPRIDFFAVLEDIHTEVYQVAEQALCENSGIPSSERASRAFLSAYKSLSDSGAMGFMENYAEALLRRLPKVEH